MTAKNNYFWYFNKANPPKPYTGVSTLISGVGGIESPKIVETVDVRIRDATAVQTIVETVTVTVS